MLTFDHVYLVFQSDDQYKDRMAALAIHLEQNTSYESTVKNADSFMRLLTNASFRSLFLWDKSEQKNKRTNMNYDVIETIPIELKMYIFDQMTRLREIFNVKRLEISEDKRPQEFCQQQWLAKIRAMFGVANGHAYLKQAMVIF